MIIKLEMILSNLLVFYLMRNYDCKFLIICLFFVGFLEIEKKKIKSFLLMGDVINI